MALQHLSQDEIRRLLKSLVDKNLLELDSSATYWITVDGINLLEIQFQMERMLQAQKSLV
jgi:predicted transcriptional regulator